VLPETYDQMWKGILMPPMESKAYVIDDESVRKEFKRLLRVVLEANYEELP
jgi:hypothetical protein